MTSWEERMAQAAHKRLQAEADRQRLEQAIEQAEIEAAQAREQLAEFEAGPENGCRECYAWVYGIWGRFSWSHRWPEDVPYTENQFTCTHSCHTEPYTEHLVAYAAAG